jgi:anaerobic nitric oxide reductase flavorubredoxin
MEIVEGVHWVGVVDKEIRSLYGQEIPVSRGTSFNVYLLLDKRIVCAGAVRNGYVDRILENIGRIVDPARIDYLVFKQLELNETAALARLQRAIPSAQLLVPGAALRSFGSRQQRLWPNREIVSGNRLPLGNMELVLYESAGLPWPDSMLMYEPGRKLLVSEHLFGQHNASFGRFDDQVDREELLDEALRYYVNMFAPCGDRVQEALKRITGPGVPVDTILPFHGVVWRSNAAGIVRHYRRWTEQSPDKKAVIVFETMLKSTQYMAEAVARGLAGEGVACRMFRVSASNRDEILAEVFRAKALLVGSPTLHRRLLPSIVPLLESLKGLRLRNRVGAAFGSYGWSGEALQQLERWLADCGISLAAEGVLAKLRPSSYDLKKCEELGRRVAQMVKNS